MCGVVFSNGIYLHLILRLLKWNNRDASFILYSGSTLIGITVKILFSIYQKYYKWISE